MPNGGDETVLRRWSESFRSDPLASRVVTNLAGRAQEIWEGTFELLKHESPEYRNAVDDEFTRESKAHCNELLGAIVAIPARKKLANNHFDFVRGHAEWRARHGVPLVASLHAYRLAHRTYWGTTREALLHHRDQKAAMLSMTMLADFWIELFDHVGAVLAEAHAVEERRVIAEGTNAYAALIQELLEGSGPRDAEARRLAALCGIRAGAPTAVALLRPHLERGNLIDVEVTLRSLVRLLDQVLPGGPFGKLIDVRNGIVTLIACCDDGAGCGLVEALRRGGFGRNGSNGTTVGVSRDTREFADLAEALEEARLALEFATEERPVVVFSDIELPEFLIRHADQAAFRLIPDWAHRFCAASDGSAQELLRTVRAFADCNLNVKRTARQVGVHANTIYFRLNRVKRLTGVDPRTYAGTSILLTALRLLELGVRGRGA